MELLEIIAAVLGVISSASFFLQALKIERMHESKDVSLPMFAVLFINAIVWLAYGFSINNWVISATYTVTVLGTGITIVEYFRYSHAKSKKERAE